MANLHLVCPICMTDGGTFTVEDDTRDTVLLRCDCCGSQIGSDELVGVMTGGRSRAERRKNDIRAAIRKRGITEHVYFDVGHPYYDNLHQFSKNKIHCSCPLCANKSNPAKGGKNWSPSDRRKLEMAKSQVDEYFTADIPELVPEMA